MVVLLVTLALGFLIVLFKKQTFFQQYKKVFFLNKVFYIPVSWTVTQKGFSKNPWYCIISQEKLEDVLSKYTLDECLIEKSSYRYVLSKGNLEDARKHFFFIEALDYVFISISPVLEGGIEDYFLEQVVIKFLEDYKT